MNINIRKILKYLMYILIVLNLNLDTVCANYFYTVGIMGCGS